jgi:hypothetical protein
MRNKIFYILILVLSFGLSSISAQTPTVPKTISGWRAERQSDQFTETVLSGGASR